MTEETQSSAPAVSISIDAYAPRQVAARVESAGIAKALLPALETVTLAVLAGAFIAFGGMLYTLAITNSGLGFGPERLLGGAAFSLGLILVVIAGAELFTGNNLIVMAWADRRITSRALLRNWVLVYFGNLLGAVATALMVHGSGVLMAGDGAVGHTAEAIAMGKLNLPFHEAIIRGILCNVLVCLAVWMCFAAHSVTGKVLVIIFPISAFVALGFEHSVANMYLIPVGLLSSTTLAWDHALVGAISNLFAVTLGNIIGGSVLVALVYWVIYLRRT
jgi:formate/nitrite transporter